MKQSTTARSTRGRKAKTDNGSSQHKAGNRSKSGNGSQSGNRSRSGNGSQSGSDDRSRSSSGRSNTGRTSSDEMRSSGSSYGVAFQGTSHLEKFFLDQLQDIYYAEQKITQSLPKMEEAATTDELKEAFDDHLHQTQKHVKRLEKVFQLLGKKAEGKKCEAIEGIAREVESIISETEEGTMTRDAALIMAAQKVEHYEIATYGGLVQLAITVGVDEAADLLDRTLMEEEDTDALLTEIAECDINLGAELESQMDGWDQGEENKGQREEEGEGNENAESETEE